MIHPRALRHALLNRIWTMIKFGICWLHRCTDRRENQVLTDQEFITLSEKTECPVHLISEKVQGTLPRCSRRNESRVIFRQKTAFPQDIKHFREEVHSPTKMTQIQTQTLAVNLPRMSVELISQFQNQSWPPREFVL